MPEISSRLPVFYNYKALHTNLRNWDIPRLLIWNNLREKKLDWIALLITAPPGTSFIHMWHVIPDKWHVTYDTWKVGEGEPFQLCISDSLGAKIFWRYFHKGWLTESVNQLMNDKGVCRTAPATPGLLVLFRKKCQMVSPTTSKNISNFESVMHTSQVLNCN